MISPCSWKQSSILSDITKRAEISAIRKYKGKTAQSQVLLGWTLPRANSPTYETIHPRELILMINLPFEYAEKQHFKISSSDLIPSLGQKTAEQSAGVEVRDLTVLRLIYWAMPAHLLLWLQTKLSWHSRQLTLPQQGQVWVRELLITSTLRIPFLFSPVPSSRQHPAAPCPPWSMSWPSRTTPPLLLILKPDGKDKKYTSICLWR